MKKAMALLLVLAMVFSLTACNAGKGLMEDVSGIFGGGDGEGGGFGIDLGGLFGGSGEGGDSTVRVPQNATPGEAMEIILLDMMETVKTESQTIGMDLTGAFGMPSAFMSLPTYDMKMRYEFDSYDWEGDTKVPTHESLDGEFISMTNGTDAMQKFVMSADGESMDGAVYFTGDTVLVQRADRTEPLVRYQLPNAGDGEAISALQPLHRFRVVLCEDNPSWLSGQWWPDYMDKFAALIQSNAGQVTSEQRTVEAGDLSAQADTYILKLEGQAAADMTSYIRGAWLGDLQIRTMLTMAENGVDSHKKDGYILDQLYDVFNGADPKVSLAVGAADSLPASMALYIESSGGRFHFTSTKLTQDDDQIVKMTSQVFGVSSPSGGGYLYTVENAKSGAGTVVQDNTQVVSMPDGTEALRFVTHSQFSGDDDGGTSNFTYRVQNGAADYSLDTSGTFTHVKEGSKINAEFSGQMTSLDEGESSEVYSFSGTMTADEKPGQIDIPAYIDASGVTVNSRQGFSDVLAPDNSFKSPFDAIEKEGAYSQVMYSFMYMLGLA